LKARFKVKDVTDEQAAETGVEPADRVLEVPPDAWAFVIGLPGQDHRAQLLNKAREGGVEGAKTFLSWLLDLYYLEHHADDFERLSYDARYLLALPDSAFVSIQLSG
jgi:hypothetical protein